MAPNMELFLVALVHGTLIGAVVIAAVSFATAALVVAFSVGLLSVAALDLLSVSPAASRFYQAAKADFELAFVLLACLFLDRVVAVALALKPLFQRLAFEFRAGARRLRAHIDAFKLN